MIQGDRTAGRVLVGAGAMVLAACSGGSDPTATATPSTRQAAHSPATPAKRGPTVAEQTVGMVSAVSLGKSTLPVVLKFELTGRPQVGQPLTINLAVLPQISTDGGSVSVASADGFEPLAAGAVAALDAMTPDEVARRSIRVTPAKTGVLLLTLGVGLTHDEITETREFTVPVLVEESAPRPPK
jgi:hypothetical protein